MKNEFWSEEDIGFLKNNFKEIRDKQIALFLNRSKKSIQHKRQRLGLLRTRPKINKCWTRKEILFLKQNYQNNSYDEIAKKLERSSNSVAHKVNRIELIKQIHDTRNPKFPQIMTPKFAYFLGLLFGDGSLHISKQNGKDRTYLKIDLHKKEKNVLVEVKKTFEKTFNKKMKLYERSNNMLYVASYSPRIAFFFNKFKNNGSWQIPEEIKNGNENIKTAFISGFFDAEGWIRKFTKRYHPRIIITQKDRKILSDIELILMSIGLSNMRIRKIVNRNRFSGKTYHQLDINQIKSIKLFVDKIKPKIERKKSRFKKWREFLS